MRWLSILGFASAENFVVFYVQISGPVGGGGDRGVREGGGGERLAGQQ